MAFSTDKANFKIEKTVEQCSNQVIRGRLLNIDLVLAEVKYHKKCYTNFIYEAKSNKYCPSTSGGKKSCVQDPIEKLFEEIRIELEQGRAFSEEEIINRYRVLTDDNERRSYSIMRSFKSQFSDRVSVIDLGKNEKIILHSKLKVHDIIILIKD